ncbi:MAG: suppressor of fused domain protein [Pirellulales bacterium]|nr:suppressor of fused domain protein [Pirellulales bacterium]
MYIAVKNGDADEARRILHDHPEQLTDYPGSASSWLHYAADKGHIRVIDVFLEAGLDINWGRRDSDDTPLAGAVDYGQYETAKYLLSRGANPNLGRCLIGAINSKTNSFELVKLLVENGCDVNQVWRFGDEEHGPLFNALGWATGGGRADIAEYLRAHGAVMPPEEPRPAYAGPREEIIAYFENCFGPADPQALREIVPAIDPPVLIHRIPPNEERNSLILFTTGMSDRPMDVPPGAEEYRCGELLMELPGEWPLSREALANPDHRWPIDWLRRVAAYSRMEETWFAPFTVIPNGDPPAPFTPGCRFSAMMLAISYEDVGPIHLQDGRTVQIYTLAPLYADEVELEKSQGLPELFRRLDEFDFGRCINPLRKSVASLP